MAARPALAGRSPGVRLVPQIVAEWSSFPWVGGAAEEGIVMRHTSAEKRKSMTRTETNDTAVRVAAAGASMAPSQSFAKPAARQKKAAPQRPKTPAHGKNKAGPKRKAKAEGDPYEAGRRTAGREQGRSDPRDGVRCVRHCHGYVHPGAGARLRAAEP